ncbi:hypothetical protein AMELA_G00276140 [Ameiurus melas]|uniref:Zeta-sarcoglycan n=1 Tax=Ameiurus melas TaxID=219545 RepID=A0A7J5ZLX7_AMEME|nr:hypothetical protein AMELA_G00276140 [Ameiurus melas]
MWPEKCTKTMGCSAERWRIRGRKQLETMWRRLPWACPRVVLTGFVSGLSLCVSTGSETVEAQCQRFEVRGSDGDRVLFSADENEVSIGTDKLRVTGNEGVVFAHSVETPHIRAEPFQDLKLESPTRTLTLEAPKGVEVNAGVGEFRASCRKELTLESSEGEIFLNAKSIRMPNLPHGSVDPLLSPGTSYPKHTVYEVCVCPSGKLYLSPADSASTCQTTNSVCLWS